MVILGYTKLVAKNLRSEKFLIVIKTYWKNSEILPRTILGRTWGYWADLWDIAQTLHIHCAGIGQKFGRHWEDIVLTMGRHWADIVVLHILRLFVFLMQYKTHQFSHVR